MEFCVKLLSLPLWERGLKSTKDMYMAGDIIVAPLVGAWIEIPIDITSKSKLTVAPLVGAWIEILNHYLAE